MSYTVGMAALLTEDQEGELQYWIRSKDIPRPLKAFLLELETEILRLGYAGQIIESNLRANQDRRPTYEQAPEVQARIDEMEGR